jgi:outer membrane immunogenic protein
MIRKLALSTLSALALTDVASAADLAVAPPPPAFTWAGLYVGGQVGYGWGQDHGYLWLNGPLGSVNVAPVYNAPGTVSPAGVIGGAHIGYNWQVNQFVLGLEGDVNGTSLHQSINPVPYVNSNISTPIQGSIRGRVGYAIDRTLLYATGGVNFGWIHNQYNVLGGANSFSTTNTGWTVGGGVEYAIDTNWSVRAEYRYTHFHYYNDGPIVFPQVFQSHQFSQNQVQVGFSYKFGAPSPAVIAKY